MTDAIDLFRGAGGWSVAARRLGVTDYGVENAKWANATATEAGFETLHEDVWTLNASDVGFPLQIASPPCPTFSVAGKGAGRKHLSTVIGAIGSRAYENLEQLRELPTDDERTNLVLVPMWAWLQGAPDAVAWEQVPAVLPVWEACAEVMRYYGYEVWTGFLQAEQYGVPQTRKRAILMARYKQSVEPPVPTHSRYYPRNPKRLDPDVKPWVSMAEGLGWDQDFTVVSNYGTGGDPRNRGRRNGDQPAATVTEKVGRNKIQWHERPSVRTSMGEPKVDGRNGTHRLDPFDRPAHTVTTKTGEWRIDGLPDWAHSRPSTTIVGSFKPEIVAAPKYRTTVSRQDEPDSVRVTVTEAGILQSFPADHPWQGGKNAQFLQVGNAVPPLLAEAILGQLITSRESRIK